MNDQELVADLDAEIRQLKAELESERTARREAEEQVAALEKLNAENCAEGERFRQAGGAAALLAHDTVKRIEEAEGQRDKARAEVERLMKQRDILIDGLQEIFKDGRPVSSARLQRLIDKAESLHPDSEESNDAEGS